MQSQVHEIDPVTVELEVQVPWERVKKGLDAGYGKLQKSAKVRGFRKGKVPRNVLKQLYGRQVDGEVVATLIEEGLLAAVQEHELAVVASPEVDDLPRIESGQPLAFKAKLEVRPKVDDVVTDGLELKRPSSEVADEAVMKEIEAMREKHAEIQTPEEERPAKEGDILTIDYVVEVDGEEKPEMNATGREVELGSGRLLPEFEEGLTGKKAGESAEIRIAYDEENTGAEELKGKRALFKVEVKELREKVLPELDDEFAKDVGEYETLDELKAKVRADLEKAANERSDSAVREQVVEQLVQKNEVPVPPSLVQQQLQSMRQELAFLMQYMGQMGGNLADLGLGDEDEMAQRAENKVRAALLMGAVAKQQELKVEAEEIEAKLAEIAEQSGKHIAKVRVEYAGERRESLENKILEDKILDYLMSRATVTDAPPEAEEAGDE